MLVISPKMGSWGCAVCYHHAKKNGEDYCGLVDILIDLLPTCPLGARD